MITTALFYVYIGILTMFLLVLPVASPLPEEMAGAIGYVQGAIDLFGWILPLDTLLMVFGLALGIEVAIFTIRWSVWLYNKVRGSG